MKHAVVIVKWALLGAFWAAFIMLIYRAYILAASGYAWDTLPPKTMLFEVMQLHRHALWGGVGGAGFRLLIALPLLVRWLIRRSGSPRNSGDLPFFDIDEKIKAIRKERAEKYLEGRAREKK